MVASQNAMEEVNLKGNVKKTAGVTIALDCSSYCLDAESQPPQHFNIVPGNMSSLLFCISFYLLSDMMKAET